MAQELLNLYSYVPNADGVTTVTPQASTSDEIDGCISTLMLSIIRAVTGDLLDKIIDRDLREHCNGCAIDHPSQRQHSCLYDPEDFYLHINAKRLLTKFFRPWLKYTIARALKLCGILHTPSLEKLQAAAETIVCELRDEPDFKKALRDIKHKTASVYDDAVNDDIVDYWNFHNTLETNEPTLPWVTSSLQSSLSPISE